jgi:Zn-dependent protease
MTWWVHEFVQQGRYVELISWIVWVLLSITLHELAHGWAAIWQGDDTPVRYQRMTANPVVHMGWHSLIMFALVGIAWGVMPVDPSRFRWRRRGRIVVSGAGPAMNVLLAFVSLTALALWIAYGPTGNDTFFNNMVIFLSLGGMLNIVLALFNLLPVPPLDGASILSGMSFRAYRFFESQQVQMFGFFIVLVLFISGIGGLFFAAADALGMRYVMALLDVLPGGHGAGPLPLGP